MVGATASTSSKEPPSPPNVAKPKDRIGKRGTEKKKRPVREVTSEESLAEEPSPISASTQPQAQFEDSQQSASNSDSTPSATAVAPKKVNKMLEQIKLLASNSESSPSPSPEPTEAERPGDDGAEEESAPLERVRPVERKTTLKNIARAASAARMIGMFKVASKESASRSEDVAEWRGRRPLPPKNTETEFGRLVRITRAYGIPLKEVRSLSQEFNALDTNGDGVLDEKEFREGLRRRCNIPAGQSLPGHLMKNTPFAKSSGQSSVDRIEVKKPETKSRSKIQFVGEEGPAAEDNATSSKENIEQNGEKEQEKVEEVARVVEEVARVETPERCSDKWLDFDAFCLWSMASAYTEVLLGLDEKERLLRTIARDHGIDIHEVEKVKKIFDRFDMDGSDDISETEFGGVICCLMRAKDGDIANVKLKRLWREIDTDGSGSINFVEFLLWYIKMFRRGL